MAKVRILHAVYSMDLGGIEVWLSSLLDKLSPDKFEFDFIVFCQHEGFFDEKIKNLGGKIFRCAPPQNLIQHILDIFRVLKKEPHYDVIHSHESAWNGTVLLIAKLLKIRIRIAHVHCDISKTLPKNFLYRSYIKVNILISRLMATHGLAVSMLAAKSYFGSDWQKRKINQLLPCGLDLFPFSDPYNNPPIRKSLGIPDRASVIGHVGSFRDDLKNHEFMLKIAYELKNENIYWLFVGEGELKNNMQILSRELGLDKKIIFAGIREDIPKIMLFAMDLFLFPSKSEGLGLAAVEAQAAGLRVICSDVIPYEINIIPQLISHLSLNLPASDWAQKIRIILETKNTVSRETALKIIQNSIFNLDIGANELTKIYDGCKN